MNPQIRPESAKMTDNDLMTLHPPLAPSTRLLWTAVVNIDSKQDLGPSPEGHRHLVPITGGQFYSDIQELNGKVLPGGADRQLVHDSGLKELDALYEMKTDEGQTLTIHNRVTMDLNVAPLPYAMSVIKVNAPTGPLDWLTRRVILGTLQSARPDREAVIIRAWEAELIRG